MGRVADPRLAAVWRRRVEQQAVSGLSVAEYCGREGISTANFYAWKRRLGIRRAATGKPVHPPGSRSRAWTGGFVQVPLTVNAAIEVCFMDGTTVRLPAEHLSATLNLLRTPQPGEACDD